MKKLEDLRQRVPCTSATDAHCDCEDCEALRAEIEEFFPTWDDPLDIDDADW